MPRRALAPSAGPQPVPFTDAHARKLRSGISQYGREWVTIHKRLFSKTGHALSMVKDKGLQILRASSESKARVAKAKRAIAKCAKLDSNRLVRKFGAPRVRAYLQFCILKVIEEDYDCEVVSPSALEDEVWHYHLLDTRNYRAMCEELCGHGNFIDHDPDGGDDEEARDARRHYAAELREEIGFREDEPKLKTPPQSTAATAQAGQAPPRLKKLNIKVVTQDGSEVFFNIGLDTPLQKLMTAFCNRQGQKLGDVRFLFDGYRINGDMTPRECSMENGDVIDVAVEQQGC